MAKTKRKPRVKQPYLAEDMAPDAVPAIDEAAESYVEARDARMSHLKTEIERQDELLQLMREHKLSTYEFDGYTVSLDTATKVKVKRKKEAGDEGDAEEGDDASTDE